MGTDRLLRSRAYGHSRQGDAREALIGHKQIEDDARSTLEYTS
jgi:hypothetical protein